MIAAIENSREEWLAARMSMIGASESPAILGEGYAEETAWTIWAKKTGLVQSSQDDAEHLEWGHAMQPVVLGMFEKRTGITVTDLGDFTILRHREYDWLGCTLDGLAEHTPDGRAVVEAKNIGQYNAKEWAEEETPLKVQIQIQHQIAVAEADVGYAVACVGGRKLEWRKVYRNDRFIKVMIKQLDEFWQCVLSKSPPANIDGSAATAKIIAKLHPNDSGEEISLSDDAVHWWRRVERCRALSSAAEKLKGEAENKLKAALGDATFGLLPNGQLLSLKTQDRAGYTVQPTSYRVLRKVAAEKKSKSKK